MSVTNLGMPRMGFFTDTSVCIGCKACEVACKEWNAVPSTGSLDLTGESFDNTSHLGANTWRHVAFIEQDKPIPSPEQGNSPDVRWLMASDVCKHCTHAACLDVCPTGALFRTVRRARTARGRRPGLQVHALLRPDRGRAGTGMRKGLPDQVDPVRRTRRVA
jgi:Fe-S-cluster-containing dehydrogenase component